MKIFSRVNNPSRYNHGEIQGITKFGLLVFVSTFIAFLVLVRLATGIRAVGVGQVGVITSYGTVKGFGTKAEAQAAVSAPTTSTGASA